jgi:hypothetical protein
MKGVGLQWASEPSQGRLLFLHLGEFVFLADNDDPVERVWADEKSALAELAAEGWEVTSGQAPDLQEVAGRNVVGYRMQRSCQ